MSHEPARVGARWRWLEIREIWASLTIMVIWLAVLFVGVFGPDFKAIDAGGNTTIIPSAIGVAFFALFATMAVAKYGFGKQSES
jgi:hypothetical protein